MTLYHLLILNSYIRGLLAELWMLLQIQCWRPTIQNFFGALSDIIIYYVTTISFTILTSQAKGRTVLRWIKCAYNESRCLHPVWSVSNSVRIERRMMFIWSWLTFLLKLEIYSRAVCLISIHWHRKNNKGIWIWNKQRISIFNHIFLNLIGKLCTCLKFLQTMNLRMTEFI